jgi:hypothetical protein
MNANASDAIEHLKSQLAQGGLRPSTDLEKVLFPDLVDYILSPGKSNASALLEKLRFEADQIKEEPIQNPEYWDKAARQVFDILLSPYLTTIQIYALYAAIKEHVDD